MPPSIEGLLSCKATFFFYYRRGSLKSFYNRRGSFKSFYNRRGSLKSFYNRRGSFKRGGLDYCTRIRSKNRSCSKFQDVHRVEHHFSSIRDSIITNYQKSKRPMWVGLLFVNFTIVYPFKLFFKITHPFLYRLLR